MAVTATLLGTATVAGLDLPITLATAPLAGSTVHVAWATLHGPAQFYTETPILSADDSNGNDWIAITFGPTAPIVGEASTGQEGEPEGSRYSYEIGSVLATPEAQAALAAGDTVTLHFQDQGDGAADHVAGVAFYLRNTEPTMVSQNGGDLMYANGINAPSVIPFATPVAPDADCAVISVTGGPATQTVYGTLIGNAAGGGVWVGVGYQEVVADVDIEPWGYTDETNQYVSNYQFLVSVPAPVDAVPPPSYTADVMLRR